MPSKPQQARPTDDQPEIPPELEDQILEILDATEPGPGRDAAITALGLPDGLQHAVTLWLEVDQGTDSGFLPSPATGSELPIDTSALPRRFGEYELESVLGRGGMGIVYRARDLRLGRVVALKVLPERFADNPKRLQRFEREIRAVAALTHPSIVPVFVAGQIGDIPYFTMELVAGQSLDKVISQLLAREQPVSSLRPAHWHESIGEVKDASLNDTAERTYLEAVCNLIICIADALQHAHDNGVTHRDVKPSNIIAEGLGRAKLFDFGLARLDDDLSMTQSSELIGSPHYMSPEQIGASVIDHRTDIYSLGVTLYELLTLKVPFDASAPQQLYDAILHREPRSPASINPQLPKDLETICLTAMDKAPDRRFQTAGDFADDLRRFLRFEPITARPIGSVTRSMRWLRRNRMPVSLVVLLIIAGVALLVTRETSKKLDTAQKDFDKETKTKQLELDAVTTKLAKETDALAKKTEALAKKTDSLKDTEARLQGSKADLASEQKKFNEKEEDVRKLDGEKTKLTESNAILKKRNDEQSALLKSKRTEASKLQSEKTRLESENKAQRGKLAQATRDLGTLEQNYNRTTINKLLMEARTLRTSNPGLGLILAHEAAMLGSETDTSNDPGLRARVDDTLLELLGTTQEQLTYTGHAHAVTAIDFSPSGAKVVSTDSEGAAHIWDRETGHPISSLRTDSALVHVEFVADDWLLLAHENGAILAWDGRTGSKPMTLTNAFHQPHTRTHSSPSGGFIVSHISRIPGQLQVHRRGTDQPERTLGTKGNPIVGFEFGPIRKWIVATTTNGNVEIWGIDDGQLQITIKGSASLLSASFDVQGRRIAILDARGQVRVISLADNNLLFEDRIDKGHPLGSGRVAFCAGDRRLIVSATGSDNHLILDSRNGAVLWRIPALGAARSFGLDRKRLLACIVDPASGFDLLNTHNGRKIAHLSGQAELRATRHRPVVAFSPDRGALATVQGETQARIWRAGPGGALQTVGPETAGDFNDPAIERLVMARFEPGNGRIVTLSNLGLSSWHLGTGSRLFLDQDPRRPLTPQALAANGNGISFFEGTIRKFVSGRRPSSRKLIEIDAKDVDQVTSWPGGGAGVVLAGEKNREATRSLLLLDAEGRERSTFELPHGKAGGGTPLPSPNGARFVIGYDVLTVVETDNPKRRVRLPFSRRPVAFSPDSLRIAASTSFSVKVWNARSGAGWCELKDLPKGYSELTDIVFSPRGTRVATAWSDGMILVHDVSRRAVPKPIPILAHRQRIHSVRFNRDGSLLLSCSDDGSARLWDSKTGRRKLTFAPGTQCVHAEFSGDGRILVACPRRVHVFPLNLRPLAERARPRELTAKEREDFGLIQRR